eukprot:gnl/MRDRNA2_/MRDRNA2_122354_c0_seq1.p1 gnl/MRDRNA2_/MRDRNA2_122354_c0~~gnl/MRDRNA2_/MRDRNA2_122354_c0_seq1.p1  ORF type:complete len:1549 (+),score=324.85 gnl/MRDRNA2_/MRDRNA2_122354_c0_seq1:93-4649(+)
MEATPLPDHSALRFSCELLQEMLVAENIANEVIAVIEAAGPEAGLHFLQPLVGPSASYAANSDDKVAPWRLHDPWWRRVWVFVADLIPVAVTQLFLPWLLKIDLLDGSNLNVVHEMAQCLRRLHSVGSNAEIIAEYQLVVTHRLSVCRPTALLQDALLHPSEVLRAMALAEIEAFGMDKGLFAEALLQRIALYAQDAEACAWYSVAAALETLGRLGCRRREVIDKLASYWLRDPEAIESPVLRNAALEALRALGVTTYKSLRKAVKDEFSGEFSRKQALFTMEFLGTFDDGTMQLLCDDVQLGRKDNTIFVVLMQGLCNFLANNNCTGADLQSVPNWVRAYPTVVEVLIHQPYCVENPQIRNWVEDVSINYPDRDIRSVFVGLRIELQELDEAKDGESVAEEDLSKDHEQRGTGHIPQDLFLPVGSQKPAQRRRALTPAQKILWYVGKLDTLEEQVDYLLDFLKNDSGGKIDGESVAPVADWCAVHSIKLEPHPRLIVRLVNGFTLLAKEVSVRLKKESLTEGLTSMCEQLVKALYSLNRFQVALARQWRVLEPFLISCCLGHPMALPIGLRNARQKAQSLLAAIALHETEVMRRMISMIDRPGQPHWIENLPSRSRSKSQDLSVSKTTSTDQSPRAGLLADASLEDSNQERKKLMPIRRNMAEAFSLQKELWEALQSATLMLSNGTSMNKITEAPEDIRPWLFTPCARGIREVKLQDPHMEIHIPESIDQGVAGEMPSAEVVYLRKESKLGRRHHLTVEESGLSASARLLHLAERRDVQSARALFKECPLVDVNAHGYIYDGGCAMAIAAQNNDLDFCRLLVEMKAEVSSPSPYGITALHIAAQYGHLEIVELLLDNHADPNDIPRGAESPLTLAAERCLAKVASVLILAGADLSAKSVSGATALSQACLHGFTEVIKVLLDAKADVDNTTAPEHSPLLNAARLGHNSSALLVLERGPKVNVKDPKNSNYTALHFAAKSANLELVRALLDAKAECDLTCWGPMDAPWTPLHLAVQSGSDLVVQRLLASDEGQNVLNVRSANGLHPVNVAIEKGLYHIEAGLRRHGGRKSLNIDLTVAAAAGEIGALKEAVDEGESHLLIEMSPGGDTPLTAALSKKHWDTANWVMEHISKEAVVQTRDQKGRSPLHIACSFKGTFAIVSELVLEYRCDVNGTSTMGETPLDFAMRRGDKETINFLAKHGGRKNLLACIAEGDTFSVRLWMDDDDGSAPLSSNIMHFFLEYDTDKFDVIGPMIEVLHENKANPNALNEQNETPLDALIRIHKSYQDKGGFAAMQLQEHLAEAERRLRKIGGLRNPKSATVRDEFRDAINNFDNVRIEQMIEEGASVNEWLREQTYEFLTMPLSWAIQAGSLPIAKVLLEHGALINGVDASGATALHHAAENGDFQACQWLCESSANLQAQDTEGLTPLDWARRADNNHIISFLSVLLEKDQKPGRDNSAAVEQPASILSTAPNQATTVSPKANAGRKVNIAEEQGSGSEEESDNEDEASSDEEDPLFP